MIEIISNGSKWAGQAPDPVEKLLAVLDKTTAGKVGMALLKFSGFNVDVDLLVKQIEWLAGISRPSSLGPENRRERLGGIYDEQEGLLNLLGALRDLVDPPV